MQWYVTGGVSDLRFYCQNAGLFMHFLFYHSFATWWTLQISVVWNCKYSLPISNPNILFLLIVCQNVVNYVEEWLCKGQLEIFSNFCGEAILLLNVKPCVLEC